MTLYRCECGKEEKQVGKATIVLRDKKWICKEAKCSCGKWMVNQQKECQALKELKHH